MNGQPKPLTQAELNEEGCRQLILAVLRMAVWDSTQSNWERASDAISFFYSDALDFYAELIGLQANVFRKTLMLDMIRDDEDGEISIEQRITFRSNYYRWLHSPVDLFGMVL